MKAITLYQPWASLIAIRAKTIETRSWKTNYRGQLAIHAARHMPENARERFFNWEFRDPLGNAGILQLSDLWLGCIVAIVELYGCEQITKFPRWVYAKDSDDTSHERVIPPPAGPDNEYLFGDYTPGRYAWLLTNIRRIWQPILIKGSLGLWDWEEPS